MKPPIKNIFVLEPSQEQKAKCIPIGFEMAEKKVYKQSHRQTFSYLYK